MSNDDYLRKQTELQLENFPHTQKVTEQQVRNDHDRLVINNHMDKIREEEKRK